MVSDDCLGVRRGVPHVQPGLQGGREVVSGRSEHLHLHRTHELRRVRALHCVHGHGHPAPCRHQGTTPRFTLPENSTHENSAQKTQHILSI